MRMAKCLYGVLSTIPDTHDLRQARAHTIRPRGTPLRFFLGKRLMDEAVLVAYRRHAQALIRRAQTRAERARLIREHAECVLRNRAKLLMQRARALPGDDVVKASVRKLSNEEARRYAELVVRLYGMFAGMKQQIHNGRGNRPAPLLKFLSVEASANP